MSKITTIKLDKEIKKSLDDYMERYNIPAYKYDVALKYLLNDVKVISLKELQNVLNEYYK